MALISTQIITNKRRFRSKPASELDGIVSAAMRCLDYHQGAVRTEELCAALYVGRSTLRRAYRARFRHSPRIRHREMHKEATE